MQALSDQLPQTKLFLMCVQCKGKVQMRAQLYDSPPPSGQINFCYTELLSDISNRVDQCEEIKLISERDDRDGTIIFYKKQMDYSFKLPLQAPLDNITALLEIPRAPKPLHASEERGKYLSIVEWMVVSLQALREECPADVADQQQKIMISSLLEVIDLASRECAEKGLILQMFFSYFLQSVNSLKNHCEEAISKIKTDFRTKISNMEADYRAESFLKNEEITSMRAEKKHRWRNMFMVIKDNRVLRKQNYKMQKYILEQAQRMHELQIQVLSLREKQNCIRLLQGLQEQQAANVKLYIEAKLEIVELDKIIDKHPQKVKKWLKEQFQKNQLKQMTTLGPKLKFIIRAIEQTGQITADMHAEVQEFGPLTFNVFTQTGYSSEQKCTSTPHIRLLSVGVNYQADQTSLSLCRSVNLHYQPNLERLKNTSKTIQQMVFSPHWQVTKHKEADKVVVPKYLNIRQTVKVTIFNQKIFYVQRDSQHHTPLALNQTAQISKVPNKQVAKNKQFFEGFVETQMQTEGEFDQLEIISRPQNMKTEFLIQENSSFVIRSNIRAKRLSFRMANCNKSERPLKKSQFQKIKNEALENLFHILTVYDLKVISQKPKTEGKMVGLLRMKLERNEVEPGLPENHMTSLPNSNLVSPRTSQQDIEKTNEVMAKKHKVPKRQEKDQEFVRGGLLKKKTEDSKENNQRLIQTGDIQIRKLDKSEQQSVFAKTSVIKKVEPKGQTKQNRKSEESKTHADKLGQCKAQNQKQLTIQRSFKESTSRPPISIKKRRAANLSQQFSTGNDGQLLVEKQVEAVQFAISTSRSPTKLRRVNAHKRTSTENFQQLKHFFNFKSNWTKQANLLRIINRLVKNLDIRKTELVRNEYSLHEYLRVYFHFTYGREILTEFMLDLQQSDNAEQSLHCMQVLLSRHVPEQYLIDLFKILLHMITQTPDFKSLQSPISLNAVHYALSFYYSAQQIEDKMADCTLKTFAEGFLFVQASLRRHFLESQLFPFLREVSDELEEGVNYAFVEEISYFMAHRPQFEYLMRAKIYIGGWMHFHRFCLLCHRINWADILQISSTLEATYRARIGVFQEGQAIRQIERHRAWLGLFPVLRKMYETAIIHYHTYGKNINRHLVMLCQLNIIERKMRQELPLSIHLDEIGSAFLDLEQRQFWKDLKQEFEK